MLRVTTHIWPKEFVWDERGMSVGRAAMASALCLIASYELQ